MNTTRATIRLSVAAALFAALGACSSVSLNTQTFGGALSGAQEVPAVTSGGSGSIEATLDKATNKLKYRVTYSGLSGPATMAHFHGPAAAGQNAGVVVAFPNASSPIEGEAQLTAAQAADLMAGRWYVNVHSQRNPPGEIRAQVLPR